MLGIICTFVFLNWVHQYLALNANINMKWGWLCVQFMYSKDRCVCAINSQNVVMMNSSSPIDAPPRTRVFSRMRQVSAPSVERVLHAMSLDFTSPNSDVARMLANWYDDNGVIKFTKTDVLQMKRYIAQLPRTCVLRSRLLRIISVYEQYTSSKSLPDTSCATLYDKRTIRVMNEAMCTIRRVYMCDCKKQKSE